MEAAETNILDETTGQVQELSVGVLDEKLRGLLDALRNIPERMTQRGTFNGMLIGRGRARPAPLFIRSAGPKEVISGGGGRKHQMKLTKLKTSTVIHKVSEKG